MTVACTACVDCGATPKRGRRRCPSCTYKRDRETTIRRQERWLAENYGTRAAWRREQRRRQGCRPLHEIRADQQSARAALDRSRADRRAERESRRKPWWGTSKTVTWRMRYRMDPDFYVRQRLRLAIRKGVRLRVPGTVSRRWLDVLAEDRHCTYCWAELKHADRTVDHVTALSRGGTNTDDNTVLACRSCNSRKHSKPLAIWLILRAGPSTVDGTRVTATPLFTGVETSETI